MNQFRAFAQKYTLRRSAKSRLSVLLMSSLLSITATAGPLLKSDADYALKMFGKFVFFDNISNPAVMSCSTCHQPSTGGTTGLSIINEHGVAVPGANPHNDPNVGGLRPPTNTYATLIGPFLESIRPEPTPENPRPRPIPSSSCGGKDGGGASGFCGGNFWNGRAAGWEGVAQVGSTVQIDPLVLGVMPEYQKYLIPAADQALNPFPNPVEQNISPLKVCKHIKKSFYKAWYKSAWGETIKCDASNLDSSFKRVAIALAAYQDSREINSFSSKRDIALRAELQGLAVDDSPGEFPLVGFSDQENYGHDLFYGMTSNLNPEGKNAQCANCHWSDLSAPNGTGLQERYTDDGFHSIGAPRNPELVNPEAEGQEGLAATTGVSFHRFMRKTPTLRNVDKRPYPEFVKAYAANGWFKSMESIVHFYNSSTLGNCTLSDDSCASQRRPQPYEETTAFAFGIARCPERAEGWTEAQALAENCWPAPEGNAPIPPSIGNLHLTLEDEAALVAYMKTFSDQYTATEPFLLTLQKAMGK